MSSVGEDIPYPNTDTLGSEWGVVNYYAGMRGTGQDCPEQTGYSHPNGRGRGWLWLGPVGMGTMLEGWG